MNLKDLINWHKEMEKAVEDKKEENDLQRFVEDETPVFVGVDENGNIIHYSEQNGALDGTQEK